MSTSTKKDDLDVFFPEGKELEIRGEKVTIKPFVLKTRMVVLRLISEIMGDLVANNPGLRTANKTAIGFAIINTAGERMIEIYRAVLDKEDEWLEMLTLPDEIRILKAISEVNNFPLLLREIQKLYPEIGKKV